MRFNENLFKDYENTTLLPYSEISDGNLVAFKDLAKTHTKGVLKANYKKGDELYQLYSREENHVGVIAATRLGKTTQYVIPTILSFSQSENKRNMLISDPKGELYRLTSETLKQRGYDVKLINFRDYKHSEFWNPLSDIFKHYQRYESITDTIEVVETENGLRNSFLGTVYENQEDLDEAIRQYRMVELESIYAEIHSVCLMMISTESTKDPHWEDTARLLLEALIIGMLEDYTDPQSRGVITEDNFSLGTALAIMESMIDSGDDFSDNGFFTSRSNTSKAFLLGKACLLDTAKGTRTSILNVFNTKMAIYKTSTVRMLTSTTSFEMKDLISDRPCAIFIIYRDELKEHYNVISTFIQQAYSYLIEYANDSPNGKLAKPFYFVLDEFGNFPAIKDFDMVVSAAGGRNVYFILILQSYAQLNNVYGQNVAGIIRDNLNIHVFIGSNNPSTLEEFSKECGEFTRISPVSTLIGDKEEIDHYDLETIPLMPKSSLSSLKTGECIVTEANCGYVMYSKLERYYLCKEFSDLPLASDKDYQSKINPLERKYSYCANRN